MLIGRAECKTEIGRITNKWHGLRRVMLYAVALTWIFVFAVYALSIRATATLAQYNIEDDFSSPEDNFAIFYGIGIIAASMLTPLFAMYYLTFEIESSSREMNLAREFFKSRPVSESAGTRKLLVLKR